MEFGNKILITGADGQVGSEIKTVSKHFPKYDFFFAGKEDLSIADENSVHNFFQKFKPNYCINCAAYTAVDKAEDHTQLNKVTALNATAVGFLAKASNVYGTKLIQLSTDYVFDGNTTVPYNEKGVTKPMSVYGATKLKGELLAAQYTDAIIIRTSWLYSFYGQNFVKTMVKLLTEKTEIKVVNDQFGSPTYAADLTETILNIINSGNWLPGIYNYSNEGQTSWYNFAITIKNLIKSTCDIKPVPTSSFPTVAKRPSFSVLDKSKIKAMYKISIPKWEDSLKKCLELLGY